MDNNTAAKWLDDLAIYFERRDTHGEDKAFWANVYNAESVRKIKAALSAAEARIERLEAALIKIRGWREIDRETLRERLAAIEEICSAALEGETK